MTVIVRCVRCAGRVVRAAARKGARDHELELSSSGDLGVGVLMAAPEGRF